MSDNHFWEGIVENAQKQDVFDAPYANMSKKTRAFAAGGMPPTGSGEPAPRDTLG